MLYALGPPLLRDIAHSLLTAPSFREDIAV